MGKWDVQEEIITVWRVYCRGCGAWREGYTREEAIRVAREDGWADGLCPSCWEGEYRAWLERVGQAGQV
jgi:hypothetical protein